MSSTALYKAFIDAGVSEEKATLAAEDVVQVSQLSQLATKSDMAKQETRMIKWIVGSGLIYTSIIIAGFSLLA